MNRRASCVGTFEVFEAAHIALRTLLAFSQPVNCIFWPIGMLNWLVAASKLHKHRETCCTAEWPFYSFLILCLCMFILCDVVGPSCRTKWMLSARPGDYPSMHPKCVSYSYRVRACLIVTVHGFI